MADALYVNPDDFKDALASAGGDGSRTAAELSDEALERHLVEAQAAVVGRLRKFKLPSLEADPVVSPPLLRTIITGYAGYTATLEWNGSQPLEDRDPVVLRYAYAREQLGLIVSGDMVVDGIDAADPTVVTGDPAIYQQTPDLGLAAGMIGGGYYVDDSFGRGWAHGLGL